MPEYEIKLEFLCEVEAYITIVPIGPSSWGIRFITPVEGGTVKGPKISGKIRSFGADWALLRPDNCIELDVRIIIETNDGALIHAYYNGVVDMTQEQVDALLGGEVPKNMRLYVTPRFETSHEKYQWLTRIQVVGRGTVSLEGDRVKVSYSWYVLTK